MYLGLNTDLIEEIDENIEFLDFFLIVSHKKGRQSDRTIALLQLLFELLQIEVRCKRGLLAIEAAKSAVFDGTADLDLRDFSSLDLFVALGMVQIYRKFAS